MENLSEKIKALIQDVKDFPKAGIIFKDISPLLASEVFNPTIEAMAREIKNKYPEVNKIAGIESRGFVFGVAVAQYLGLPFVMIRKKGKLPPEVITYSYETEYSKDTIEMKRGSGNLVIVDDVLATGGTLEASVTLAQKAGYQVKGLYTLIDLTFLHGELKTGGINYHYLISY